MSNHPHAPTFLAVFADFNFVLMDGVVQRLEHDYGIPDGEVAACRMGLTLLVSAVWLAYKNRDALRHTYDQGKIPLLVIRGTNNSFSLVMIKVQFAATFISIAAVVLVVQPAFLFPSPSQSDEPHPYRLIGFVLAIAGTLTSALDFYFLRKIGPDVDSLVVLVVYAATGVVIGPIWVWISGSKMVAIPPYALLLIVFVAITGTLAQLALTLSLQSLHGGKAAILGYAQIIFSILLQVLLVGKMPSGLAMLGMAMIIGAGVRAALYGDDKEGAGKGLQSAVDEEQEMAVVEPLLETRREMEAVNSSS
ncbi:hypothetical protein IAT38_000020 [Cryptococcus sp. DSM 104549]